MTSVTHCRTGKTADEESSSTYIRLLSQVNTSVTAAYIGIYNTQVSNNTYI